MDVAHGMVKDMSQPFKTEAEMLKIWDVLRLNGNEPNIHPLWDRSEVHEIYKTWRSVFNEYDPPLT